MRCLCKKNDRVLLRMTSEPHPLGLGPHGAVVARKAQPFSAHVARLHAPARLRHRAASTTARRAREEMDVSAHVLAQLVRTARRPAQEEAHALRRHRARGKCLQEGGRKTEDKNLRHRPCAFFPCVLLRALPSLCTRSGPYSPPQCRRRSCAPRCSAASMASSRRSPSSPASRPPASPRASPSSSECPTCAPTASRWAFPSTSAPRASSAPRAPPPLRRPSRPTWTAIQPSWGWRASHAFLVCGLVPLLLYALSDGSLLVGALASVSELMLLGLARSCGAVSRRSCPPWGRRSRSARSWAPSPTRSRSSFPEKDVSYYHPEAPPRQPNAFSSA